MTRRLFATAAAALSVGVAVAAPVPKAPPAPAPKASATLTLATAKMNGQFIQITSSVTVMETAMQQEVVVQDGQQVTIAKPVIRSRQVQQTYQMTVQGTKATTADGKELSDDDLAKKLGDGAAVVQAPANLDPEWKKLFANDVIFLEPKAVARPGGVGFGGGIGVAPGGPVVMPAPALVPIQAVPVQAVPVEIAPPPPLPVEKK
jgi:hypothetical protein